MDWGAGMSSCTPSQGHACCSALLLPHRLVGQVWSELWTSREPGNLDCFIRCLLVFRCWHKQSKTSLYEHRTGTQNHIHRLHSARGPHLCPLFDNVAEGGRVLSQCWDPNSMQAHLSMGSCPPRQPQRANRPLLSPDALRGGRCLSNGPESPDWCPRGSQV